MQLGLVNRDTEQRDGAGRTNIDFIPDRQRSRIKKRSAPVRLGLRLGAHDPRPVGRNLCVTMECQINIARGDRKWPDLKHPKRDVKFTWL